MSGDGSFSPNVDEEDEEEVETPTKEEEEAILDDLVVK